MSEGICEMRCVYVCVCCMHAGVRQLNLEFAKKDFLEATGIRKESGGWERDQGERDPHERQLVYFLARLIQVFAE